MRAAGCRGSLPARRASTARTTADPTASSPGWRPAPRTGLVRPPPGPGSRRARAGGRQGRTRLRSGSRRPAPCARAQPRPGGPAAGSGPAAGRPWRPPRARAGRGSGHRPRSPGRRASNRRTARTPRSVPSASAGRRTSVTSWRRAASKRNASVSGSLRAPTPTPPVRARSTSRIRSPSQVPPGSRVDEHIVPARTQPGGQPFGLGRLAGPFGAFDGDEPAAGARGPGCRHGPSVAEPGCPSDGDSSIRDTTAYHRRPARQHPG